MKSSTKLCKCILDLLFIEAYSTSVYTDNNHDNRDFSQAIIDIEKFQYSPSLLGSQTKAWNGLFLYTERRWTQKFFVCMLPCW